MPQLRTAQHTGAYHCFCSIKRLGVSLLLDRDAGPAQFSYRVKCGTHFYSWSPGSTEASRVRYHAQWHLGKSSGLIWTHDPMVMSLAPWLIPLCQTVYLDLIVSLYVNCPPVLGERCSSSVNVPANSEFRYTGPWLFTLQPDRPTPHAYSLTSNPFCRPTSTEFLAHDRPQQHCIILYCGTHRIYEIISACSQVTPMTTHNISRKF
jgi:hypothetical protein